MRGNPQNLDPKWYGNNGHNTGRPKGSRNRFNALTYEMTLAFLEHKVGQPAPPQYDGTELWAALKIAARSGTLLKFIGPMLDKNYTVEHTKLKELSDNWLDLLIERNESEMKMIGQGADKMIELKAEPCEPLRK